MDDPGTSELDHGVSEPRSPVHADGTDAGRLKAILEACLDAAWTLDTQGHLLDVNDAACRMLGYTRGEMIGRSIRAFEAGHSAAELDALGTQIAESGSHRLESRHRTKAGEEIEVEISVTWLPADQQMVAFIRDVSGRKRAEQELYERERRIRDMVNSTQGIVWEADARTFAFTFVSDKAERLLGFPVEDWYKPGFWVSRLHPEDQGWAPRHCAACTLRLEDHDFEYRFIAADGRTVWLRDIVTVVEEGGQPRWLRGIMIDITDRKQADASLREAASVFAHANEGIIVTERTGRIVDVNDAFTRMTGYSREEALGRNPRFLQSGRQDRAFYETMWATLIGEGRWTGELWNRRKDGQLYAEKATITCVRGEDGEITRYVALLSDVTALKNQHDELQRIAHFDALTGLPNRVLLYDRLQQAIAQAERTGQILAVVYLDLDGFKAVNDAHSHLIGDHLLVLLCGRLAGALREGDTLARIGGDEFVAVLIGLPHHEATGPILTRLLAAAAEPIRTDGLELRVSASLGVSFYPQRDPVDADQLIRQADQAMYQAKQAGKNRYHIFDAERDRAVRGHHETIERIRVAIDRAEFELHYQPKVNLRTGEVLGFEALVRWRHPERGLLSPASFLPILQGHPLIVDLGNWVLDDALRQAAAWRADGLVSAVSVNVDALQLQQPDFMDRVHDALARHPGARPSDLELEVLETSALDDIGQISTIIRACQELGVAFALDDFGTGYSSLTYLKRLPAEHLKIDRSFVFDMLDDPEDLAILHGVLGLARAFRRRVIAEGVETLAHGDLLIQMGCELGQGYAIARPMPAAEVRTWLAGWRPNPRWTRLSAVRHDDVPALFGAVEHRAWLTALRRHLQDHEKPPPPMEATRCRLAVWLHGEGGSRYGRRAGFAQVRAMHAELHRTARALLAGQPFDVESQLAEVDALHRSLVEALCVLVA